MAVLDTTDQMAQLWGLIQELSEQLNQNRSIAVSLHTQMGNIKVKFLFDTQSCCLSSTYQGSSRAFSDGICSATVSRFATYYQ